MRDWKERERGERLKMDVTASEERERENERLEGKRERREVKDGCDCFRSNGP